MCHALPTINNIQTGKLFQLVGQRLNERRVNPIIKYIFIIHQVIYRLQ